MCQIHTDIGAPYSYYMRRGPGYRIYSRQQPPSSMQTHHDEFLRAVRNSGIDQVMFA